MKRLLTFPLFIALLLSIHFSLEPSEISTHTETGRAASPQALDTPLQPIEFVASIGGSVNSIAVMDSFLYINEGSSLTTFDISDTLHPLQAARLPLPDMAQKIFPYGGRLYLADSYGGLIIASLQDPSKPAIVGGYDTPGVAVNVAISNSIALVADGYAGLQILDVSDPANIRRLGNYLPDTGNFVSTAGWVGELVYLPGPDNAVLIIDIHDPTAPVVVNQVPECTLYMDDISVEENIAYLPCSEGLKIFDVSDPAHPRLLGTAEGTYFLTRIYVKGGIAYLTHGDQLIILDVHDPSHPIELSSTSVGPARDLTLDSGRAFIVLDLDQVDILDVSDPASPRPAGSFTTLGGIKNFSLRDNFLYASSYTKGLAIIDVHDPENPALVSSIRTQDLPGALAIEGNNAYVASITNPILNIFDLTNPLSPTLTGSLPETGGSEIDARNEILYLAGGELQIIQAGNPISPTLLATYPEIRRFVIQEDLLYGMDSYGFQIVDMRNPALPNPLGGYTLDSPFPKPTDIAAQGSFVYLIGPDKTLENSLLVIDAHDPNNPLLLASLRDYCGNLKAAGGYLFAQSGIGCQTLNILDLHNPAAPKIRASYALPATFQDLILSGDLVYLADASGGIIILRLVPARFASPAYLPVIANASLLNSTCFNSICPQVWQAGAKIAPAVKPPVPALPAQQTYTVMGRTLDMQGMPVKSATVTASNGLTATSNLQGFYRITGLVTGTYILQAKLGYFNFLPYTQTISVPPNAPGTDFFNLDASLLTAEPCAGLGVSFGDRHGQTWIILPRGAVTQTTTLLFSQAGAVQGAPAGYELVGAAFDLDSYKDGSLLEGFTFRRPITLTFTLAYQFSGFDEKSLAFFTYKNGQWLDAACGPYERDFIKHELSAPVCHISRFALFGIPFHPAYLPVVSFSGLSP